MQNNVELYHDVEDGLSQEERDVYMGHIAFIKQNLKTFYDVGIKLAEIRDKRLYREKYMNWEDFCEEEVDLAKRYADRLISSAITMAILRAEDKTGPSGPQTVPILPANERQLRPLAKFLDNPPLIIKIWNSVVSLSEQTGRSITSALVDEAVILFFPVKKPGKEESKPTQEQLWKEIDDIPADLMGINIELAKRIQVEIDQDFPTSSRRAMVFLLDSMRSYVKSGKKVVDALEERPTEKQFRKLIRIK